MIVGSDIRKDCRLGKFYYISLKLWRTDLEIIFNLRQTKCTFILAEKKVEGYLWFEYIITITALTKYQIKLRNWNIAVEIICVYILLDYVVFFLKSYVKNHFKVLKKSVFHIRSQIDLLISNWYCNVSLCIAWLSIKWCIMYRVVSHVIMFGWKSYVVSCITMYQIFLSYCIQTDYITYYSILLGIYFPSHNASHHIKVFSVPKKKEELLWSFDNLMQSF